MTDYDIRVETWNCDTAKDALARLTPGQRKIDSSLVGVFKMLHSKGKFHPGIGAPIAFDQAGTLQNGTHRATFIAGLRVGETADVLVARDMPEWAIKHYDSGKNRTPGNFLGYAFPDRAASLCNSAASIASVVMSYRGPGNLPKTDWKPRSDQLVEWAIDNGEKLFEAATAARKVTGLQSKFPKGNIATERMVGFILFFLPESEEFFRNLAARMNYDGSDPRSALRVYFDTLDLPPGARSRQIDMLRLGNMLSAWDAYQRGQKFHKWNGEESSFRHPMPIHPIAA